MLVGEKETWKVTDFGMARDVQQENIYERNTKVIGKSGLNFVQYYIYIICEGRSIFQSLSLELCVLILVKKINGIIAFSFPLFSMLLAHISNCFMT